jgi:hypothetical protein
MVDIDIVQIPLNDFLLQKQNLVVDSKLNEKIKELIESFSCFKEHIPNNSGSRSSNPSSVQRNNPHKFNNKYHHNSHQVPRPRTHFNHSGDKDSLGLLNKLSPSNQDVILQKLLRICFQRTDISTFLYELIDRGSHFASYFHLILSMLKEVNQRYSQEVSTSVNKYIHQFDEAMCQSIYRFREEPPTHEYDDYCLFVKDKELLINRFTLVVLLSLKFQDHTPTVLDVILNNLYVFVSENAMPPLMCHIIVELCTVVHKNDTQNPWTRKILALIVQKFDAHLMKKTQFKIQDILV